MPPAPREIHIGDEIRVSRDAPATYGPEATGTVVEIRRLEDEGVGCRVPGGPAGAIVRIRCRDGEPLEVPAHLLQRLT